MEYAVATSSLGHTVGNITSHITEYVKTLFPHNFFRTVHVSSTIAYKQLSNYNYNEKEFIKKLRPILVIRPRIDLSDTDVFMGNTYFTTRILDDMLGDVDFNNLQPFILDKEKQVYINFLLNRLKITFDITVIIETQISQLNIAHYFRNIVRQDRPFMLEVSLENHIPKHFMYALAKDIGIPIHDNDNNVANFLTYLNTHSIYPITYKLKNSTGNDEFFRFYTIDLDTTISGFSMDDLSKRGSVSDNSNITFAITCEFFTSGLYYYFTANKATLKEVQGDISAIYDKSNQLVPLFTIPNFFQETLKNGWKLYNSSMYKVTDDNNIPDTLDISPILSKSLLTFINYHTSRGMPVDTFLEIRIFKDNMPLVMNLGHFSFDPNTMILTTNFTNKFSTYRIFIYLNTLYANQLASEVLELTKEK